MNIDYNAVIEILKCFLNNENVEILGISVGEERQVREAIKNLLTAYEKEKEEKERIGKLYYEANENCIKYEKELEKEKEKNEELKEENKKYIVQLTDEQYRKLVDIIRDEISKEWKDKIKAKIEEVHYKMIGHQDLREAVKQALQSLLEKE